MTREAFIKKWLGNNNFQYCEEHKELMREDLDSVIDYHQQQVKSVDLADVVGRSEQLPQIHGLIKCECGKVYDVDIENNCPSCGN